MINNTKEMTKKLLLFASLLLIIACSDKKEKEIAAIPMSFETVRLDSLFVKTPDAQFPALRHQYPSLSSLICQSFRISTTTLYMARWKNN